MEPWLDSLSEDWNSQPRSSSPSSHASSLKFQSRYVTPHSDRPGGDASKPLPSQNEHPTSNRNSQALREQTWSRRNVQDRQEEEESSVKLDTEDSKVKKSTGSIYRSVLIHNTESRNKSTIDASRLPITNWKKADLANQLQNASSNDLFTPNSLEKVFRRPLESDENGPQGNFSLSGLAAIDYGFIDSQSENGFQTSQDTNKLAFGAADDLRDIQEKYDTRVFHNRDNEQAQVNFDEFEGSKSNNAEEFVPSRLSPDRDDNTQDESWSPDRSRRDTRFEHSRLEDSRFENCNGMKAVKTFSSSSVGDLSPVYVSKHNTVDGDIGYTALDLSKADMRNKMESRSSSIHFTASERSLSPITNANEANCGESVRPLERMTQPASIPNLQHASKQSEPREFPRMSYEPPTASSPNSLLPCDSVSQIKGVSNHDLLSSQHGMDIIDAPDQKVAVEEGSNKDTTIVVASQLTTDKSLPNEAVSVALDEALDDQITLFQTHNIISGISNLQGQSKREAPLILRQPTPKRLRTMTQSSILQPFVESHANQIKQTQVIIGRKRKDARVGTNSELCDPVTLAKRQILRPKNLAWTLERNPRSPSMHSRVNSGPDNASRPDGVSATSYTARSREAQVKNLLALACEAKTFQSSAQAHSSDNRKPSVSTQDYLDEAMKIMELIRSRENIISSSHDISDTLEPAQQDPVQGPQIEVHASLMSQNSEFGEPEWRPRTGKLLDPRILSYLQKYEETGDESFLVSSIVRSVKTSRNEENEDATLQEGAKSKTTRHGRRYSDSSLSLSGVMRDKEDKTLQTAQVTREVQDKVPTPGVSRQRQAGNISPDQFSRIFGPVQWNMHFDAANHTWIKASNCSQFGADFNFTRNPSASDDPFEEISDLEVSDGGTNEGNFEDVSQEHSHLEHEIEGGSLHELIASEDLDVINDTSIADMGRRRGSKNIDKSEADTYHEISFIQRHSDGRTLSLSFGMSTPFPHARNLKHVVHPSSMLRSHSLIHSLSPLSDFSIHQNDTRHLQASKLLPYAKAKLRESFDRDLPVAAKDLVAGIMDAEPEEPYWDWMATLSMPGKQLQTLHMLDEFCPRLENLDVSRNLLTQLNGIPASVRDLNLSNNSLSALTHWRLLHNLQYLDVSNNNIEGLEAFNDLIHLRELKADNNRIRSLEGLLDLDGLLKLSMSNNQMEILDTSDANLQRLEYLDVSNNTIKALCGLEHLPKLAFLDLSSNILESLSSQDPATSIRVLKVNNNKLKHIDMLSFPQIVSLEADGNALLHLQESAAQGNPKYLSLCDQTLDDEVFEVHNIHNGRHLFLSGTPLPKTLRWSQVFMNLHVIDLSFTGLQSLPSNFGTCVPMLQTLNLSANSIKSLRPLRGIMNLRKLYAANNRLDRLRKVIRSIESVGTHLSELDLRNNPICLGFYASVEGTIHERENNRTLMKMPNSRNIHQRLANSILNELYFGSTDEACSENVASKLRFLPPCLDEKIDREHQLRLDQETRLRRRVYEMLLCSKCPILRSLDGRCLDLAVAYSKDDVWGKLVELGVVQKKGSVTEQSPSK